MPAIQFLAAAARAFCHATAPDIDYQQVRLDSAVGRSIARAYLAAPRHDPRAVGAYRAFRDETIRQFRFLTGLGVLVEVVGYDPYDNAGAMLEDLARYRLKVFSTKASGNPHPYLSDRENDMFRAVHDAFGHAATGRGFSRDGEEAAWMKHCLMYSPRARRALATETRGQSCTQIFHYGGAIFPEQKLALLPRRFSEPPPSARVRP